MNDFMFACTVGEVEFCIGGTYTPADWLTGREAHFTASLVMIDEQEVLALLETFAPRLISHLETLALEYMPHV